VATTFDFADADFADDTVLAPEIDVALPEVL
jgi:hypothetical protein